MIYLDNGATTYPKPQGVLRAVSEAMAVYGANPGRAGHRMSLSASEQIFKCRMGGENRCWQNAGLMTAGT